MAVAIGTDGRIRIGGPTLFDGYDGDPELTARRSSTGGTSPPTPAASTRTAGCTCSAASTTWWSAAASTCPCPRSRARLREHPAVEAVEVLGVEDEEWGQRVVAFVVAVGGAALDEARDWVGEVHPRSWAPRQVVVLDSLPLLDNGKVDRQALVALAGEAA